MKSLVVIGIFTLMATQSPGNALTAVNWHQPPWRIKAGEAPLDSRDTYGHAAPALVDIDGDGLRDLVVGTFAGENGGKFRYFRNIGSRSAPKFESKYEWLLSGEHQAKAPTWCCVAATPALADINGDGHVDLVTGSYGPGALYWFKGMNEALFEQRQMLIDGLGVPIFAHIETIRDRGGQVQSYGSMPTFVDWDFDGRLDLIFGTHNGEVHLRLNTGADFNSTAGLSYDSSQPLFEQAEYVFKLDRKPREQSILPRDEKQAAPQVADWDGDGLLDLIIGTNSGTVYFLRNSGSLEQPLFETREILIPAGVGANQWADKNGDAPARGIRSQIQVVDYNLDGKLDIILGDWSNTIAPRNDLTPAEKAELSRLTHELAEIDKEVGYNTVLPRAMDETYSKNKVFFDRAHKIEDEMDKYLILTETSSDSSTSIQGHGYVWVFLQR